MDAVFIKVYSNTCKYDKFLLGPNEICAPSDVILGHNARLKRRRIKIYIDGILIHYIVQEFRNSVAYCRSFLEKCLRKNGGSIDTIKFILLMPPKQIIDYDWNYRTTHMARERAELDHALSWLSTLGGAFSALGDYSANCAEVAGKISYHQLSLAMRLGDPTIASRCRLYFSLSLIQRRYFKLARKIIEIEYEQAKSAVIQDTRLLKMCLGIWAKLQYEHRRSKELQEE